MTIYYNNKVNFMDINNITRNFYRFLNEGRAEAFRDAYYPEIDDYILNKIIEIDPESNGDDVSEWGKFLMKLNPTHSDIPQAGEDIAIIAKAVKLGKDIPALNNITTMEELHYLAIDIANEKGHMSDDEIKTQEESLNCPIVFDDGGFRVLEINSPECADHYGKGTMWPWAAQGAEGGMFQQLSQRGKIFVIKNENDDSLYSLVKIGNRLRLTDVNDEPVDKSMFPQELISSVMNINEGILDLFKQEKTDPMIEKVAEGIVSALHKNFNNRGGEVGNSELKTAMNRVCNAIKSEDELDGGVKDIIVSKSRELLNDSTRLNGSGQEYMMVKPEMLPEILNKTADVIENGETPVENSDEPAGISENTLKMNGSELNELLYEALGKQVDKLMNEKQNMKVKITETELREMVTESVKRQLTEAFSDIYNWENFDNNSDTDDEEYIPDYIDCIDPATLSDVLETMGWSYYDSRDIKDKQGRDYIAYACRPAANSKYGIEEVIDTVKKTAEMPNGIFYKELAHRYAPEQSTYWIIVEVVPKENYGKQLKLNM